VTVELNALGDLRWNDP